ncbi:hybrid sensor histidine kinase/response regulator [Streptomyces olivaceoviridis]|uniref:hybrid sensor histidine kinase/response regulator n=1 Tax=Streptomyces olivaceoviridis TaxID=1921 RepID=UPI0036FCAEAE
MSSRPSRGAARLAAILDALPDALVLVNANGTVVNANTIALEAFETPGTALVGRGLLDLLPEFDSRLIPGSMRRPDHMDPTGRTKPTRMVARRTDGTEFPVEVTSANLENGQQAYDGYGYTGDELLMLVVRDLSGTVDTEAELARSQRQTEMILRAAAEGVVGTDTDGRIVLVNPAAAQILGYRAGELGGKELHTLVLHSRADGSPFPYDESPLADTLRSGRKHRVRGQVLWSKGEKKVPVDLTTAPVRDGDQLVGAVMTFTDRRPYDALVEEKDALEKAHAEDLERLSEEHASDLTALRQRHVTEIEELREQHTEELAAGEERYAALAEREKDRYEALAGRHEQLLTLLGQSLRGPLDELRRELSALAADDAGQLWPEANQVLHHLSAGYSRITTLIDNVLGYQRLDAGSEDITRTKVMLDAVVAAGVDGAVELIGPGRVQFAVHAPPIEAEVDPQRLATALAHLVADVAGVDATGNTPVSAGGYLDNTVVVAAAQRGEVARIEVRGPYAGGDPVHEPIVRGIVRAHGGVLQTHEVPGMSGSAYVLEVPLGGGAGAVAAGAPGAAGAAGAPVAVRVPDRGEGGADDTGAAGQGPGGGRRRARRASTDAFLDSDVTGAGDAGETEAPAPTGRRRRRAAAPAEEGAAVSAEGAENASGGTGRRRGRPGDNAEAGEGTAEDVSEGSVVTSAEQGAGAAASGTGLGGTVPPQGVPVPTGRRARHDSGAPQAALPPALPAAGSEPGARAVPAEGVSVVPAQGGEADTAEGAQPTGRRRRALAAAAERAAAQEAGGARTVFALPPAEADRSPDTPGPEGGAADATGTGTGAGAAVPVPPGGGAAAGPGTGVPVAPGAGGQAAAGAGAPVAPGAGVPAAPGAGVPVAPGTGGRVTPGAPVAPGAGAPVGPDAGVPTSGPVAPGAGVPAGGPVTPGVGVPVAPGAVAPAVPGTGPAAGGRPGVAGPVAGAGPLPGQVQVPARMPVSVEGIPGDDGRHDAVPLDQADDHTPPQPHPTSAPTGRRRRAGAQPAEAARTVAPATGQTPAQPLPAPAASGQVPQGTAVPLGPGPGDPVQAGATAPGTPGHPAPAPVAPGQPATAPAAPASATPAHGMPAQGTPGHAPQGQGTAPHLAPAQPGTPAAGTPVASPGALPLPAEAGTGQVPAGAQAAPVPPGVPQQWPGADDASGTGTRTPVPGVPAADVPQQWPGSGDTSGAKAPGAPAADVPQQWPGTGDTSGTGIPAPGAPAGGRPQRVALPLPAEAAPGTPVDPDSTQGRAISVRTLGQGVPFARQAAQVQQPTATPPPHAPGGSGRRRKLGTRPDPAPTGQESQPDQAARPHPSAEPASAHPTPTGQPSPGGQNPLAGQPSLPHPSPTAPAPVPQSSLGGQARPAQGTEGGGRSYAIGAPEPDAAEGPEPLDGPGGAVEVSDTPRPQPLDDELPPEPLDNPRRLLVWPAPDVTTQQALSDRGYRPVIVHSREEVDAQIAAFPAALFVDPLTGPITRTALQSLRQAAVAAEVPVLVTAGLGQATREAAYGADPAVLLKALAPRDSEQHPPRVLLIEEHAEIALALTATLERRGMQVARAANDNDAVTLAGQFRPNLVVMDLMQVHRRRAGIVDWLRANGQLNRTPLVVYTAAVDPADLPRLASGETVLFLAERSTSGEVQSRIVDLLARIGTN